MTCLEGHTLLVNLVYCDVPTGDLRWFACESIPSACKKLRVRVKGGIQVTIRVACPTGPADWKASLYIPVAASNPSPEIIDPPSAARGTGAVLLRCLPTLRGYWRLATCDLVVEENIAACVPPAARGYWRGYFSGDYWGDGYWESTGPGPPPPPGGYFGAYFGPYFGGYF